MNLEKIPFAAWIVIGLAVIFIIALNFSLVGAWRRRNVKPEKKAARPSFWQKAWEKEDRQFAELSRQVAVLKKDRPMGTDEPPEAPE